MLLESVWQIAMAMRSFLNPAKAHARTGGDLAVDALMTTK
jgi:hypothetical protein